MYSNYFFEKIKKLPNQVGAYLDMSNEEGTNTKFKLHVYTN